MSFLGWLNNKELQAKVDQLAKKLSDEEYAHKVEKISLSKKLTDSDAKIDSMRMAGDALSGLLLLPGKKASKATIQEVVSNWEAVR